MISVLTPTYNRVYILGNAFESLKRQTCEDFEWIIVDDGSTDETESLVKSWEKDDLSFNLCYIKQENGGKHRAVNKGVAMAKGEFVIILDSDDYLTDNAIEKICDWTNSIKGDDSFAGVSGLRGWINKDGYVGGSGNLQGTGYIDAKNTERRKYHLEGDKAEVYRTEILRKFPFPEFEGEKFLSEHVVWDAIANAGYKIRWYNEIIYKCEYLDDGLTYQGRKFDILLNNFNGFTLSTKIYMSWEPFLLKYIEIGKYYKVAKLKGKSRAEIKDALSVNNLQIFLAKILCSFNEFRIKIKACRHKKNGNR